MSKPTAGWERVGGRFYRKIKLYDAIFDQDLELENHIIAGAPCAGAIGVLYLILPAQVKLMSFPSIISRPGEDSHLSGESNLQIKH